MLGKIRWSLRCVGAPSMSQVYEATAGSPHPSQANSAFSAPSRSCSWVGVMRAVGATAIGRTWHLGARYPSPSLSLPLLTPSN